MYVFRNQIKFLLINIIIFVVVCCININPAYAENNSFAPETLILTPNGNIPIEDLHSGDRVIGYNFETHQEEIHHVKDIQPSSSLSYYLINNQTKISGNNYVYVKVHDNPIVKKVYRLKDKDKLIGQNSRDYSVKQISQIVKPSEFYRMSLEKKEENFFLNNFLIYNGNTVPNKYNEKYKHLNCDIGSPYPDYRSWECVQKDLAFPQFLIAIVFLVVGLLFSIKTIDWVHKIY